MPFKTSPTKLVAEVVLCFSIVLLVSDQTFRRSLAAPAATFTGTTSPALQQEAELIVPVHEEFELTSSAGSSQGLDLPSTLVRDVTVCTPEGGGYKDIASVTVTPKTAQTIFLQAKTTTKRVPCPEPNPSDGGCANSTPTSGNLLAGMRILWFFIKTQVTLLEPRRLPFVTAGPIVVEYGNHADPLLRYMDGRSIAIVVQDFPIN